MSISISLPLYSFSSTFFLLFLYLSSSCSLLLPCSILAEEAEIKRELLIVSCARSGSSYIAKVLQRSGFDIGHEYIGKDGVASWVMTVDAETTPWGPSRKNMSFAHVFHQVRNPLDVISSVYTTEGPKSWGFITSTIPEIKLSDSYLVRSAKYWYYWNLKGDELAEFTYRVEDIQNVWDEFEKRLGKKFDRSVLSTITNKVNSREMKPPRSDFDRSVGRAKFTWEDLKKELDPELYEKIQQLAKKYGYL